MSRIGLFTPAADSAPLPGSGSGATPPGPGATGEFQGTETTGLPVPAKNINELQGQIGALISAFHSEENRLPTQSDGEFWAAYRTLVERYKANEEAPSYPARVRG